MSNRAWVASGVFMVVAFVSTTWVLPVEAQSGLPRTSWGKPDLQGIWDFRTITPMQRPEDLADREFLTETEVSNREKEIVDRNARANAPSEVRTEPLPVGGNVGGYNNFWMDRGTRVVGTRRTSLIIDPSNGRYPVMTEGGRQRAARRGSFSPGADESYVDLSNADRCIIGFNAGPPITPAGYNQNMQLFQTPGYVAILNEMVHNARIIPLDGRPGLSEKVPQWSGDSRGYWEGDTLVIETSNFNTPENQRRWRGATENMTLVERLTRVDSGTLEYQFTVTDPETWEASWTVSIPMVRTDVPMYEFACHEGNYGLFNILAGARMEELAEAVQ